MSGFSFRKKIEHRLRVLLGRAYRPIVSKAENFSMLGGEEEGYGVWPCVLELLNSNSVVYSAGVGFDIKFDLALMKRTGVTVFAFDPTPRVVEWIRESIDSSQFRFEPIGLGSQDAEMEFALPLDEKSVSGTLMAEGTSGSRKIKVPVERVRTIMKRLLHEKIDLLKLDIEGAEYGVLRDMLDIGILPTQILVEFHHGKRKKGRVPVSETKNLVERLKGFGYSIFWASESGRELALVRRGAA